MSAEPGRAVKREIKDELEPEVTFGDLFDEGPEEEDKEEAEEEVGEGNGNEETGGQDEVFGMLVACTFRCEFNHGDPLDPTWL